MRFEKLDLNLLVCLDALLAERSVSKAAEKLFVTQPAMSLALSRLREYFDDPLLVQVGRRMLPTAFAEELSGPLREVLLQIRQIVSVKPTADPSAFCREIVVGASDFVCAVLLTTVLRRISAEAPGIKIRTVSIMGTRFIDALQRGELDILIIPAPYASPDHSQEVLFSETLSCIVWSENPLVGDALSVDQYLQLGHVAVGSFLYETDHRAYEDRFLKQLGRSRRVEVSTSSPLLLPAYTVGTNRIATVHTRLAQRYVKDWPVSVVPFPLDIPPLVEVMQSHPYNEHDPVVSWFRQVVREEAARI